MLKKFMIICLINSFFILNNVFGLNNTCVKYNQYNESKCSFIKNNIHTIYIKDDLEKLLYKVLEIQDRNDEVILINNKLLASSMKDNNVTAQALKNITFEKKMLKIQLGKLKGNNYLEFIMYFKYIRNRYLLENVNIMKTNFFKDISTSKKYYKIKELDLKDLTYHDYIIKDKIFNYIEEISQNKTISSQKQPLYKTPPEKTKMYLIKGDKVEVLEEKNDWLYILYKGKQDIKAWIPKKSIK